MSEIIFFDTETSGIPDWKLPSGGKEQPHLVQLAALVVDSESREIIQSMDHIIKPDDWKIKQDTIDVHGITTDHALEVGLPEKDVLEEFLEMWDGKKRIAFNTTFDNRIIRIATKRYTNDKIIDYWYTGNYECAMQAARKIMKSKVPKLAEAYKFFTGKDLQDAHTAMGDAKACMELYFAIKDKELVAA